MSWIFTSNPEDDEEVDDEESYSTDDDASHDSEELDEEGSVEDSNSHHNQLEEREELHACIIQTEDHSSSKVLEVEGETMDDNKADDHAPTEICKLSSSRELDADCVLVGNEDVYVKVEDGQAADDPSRALVGTDPDGPIGDSTQNPEVEEGLGDETNSDDHDNKNNNNNNSTVEDGITMQSDSSKDSEEMEDEEENSNSEDDDDDAHSEEEAVVETVESEEEPEEEEEEDEDEEVTSFWEKQSLLVLAAEHDRVDILKAILKGDDAEETSQLMNSGIPPIHIAITFGSTNATQSLLRMGADPSIRPDVAKIKQEQMNQPEGSKVEIPNMGRFDGVTAWELAFGSGTHADGNTTPKSRWSFFGSSNEEDDDTHADDESAATSATKTRRNVKPVDMAPSKREGIRHAFTAEALRCIGGDEVKRLRQLIDSGMPPTIDLGGKDLYGWAVEMGAMKCEELLRPSEAAKHQDEDLCPASDQSDSDMKSGDGGEAISAKSAVLDRSHPGDDSVPRLVNRLDELDALARALSTCLDSLAEEVSVCHGLLLMGGGASALASHVRSLKMLKQQKLDKLQKVEEEWGHSEDELTVLIQNAKSEGVGLAHIDLSRFLLNGSDATMTRSMSFVATTGSPEEEESQRRQLNAQIAASENKVRKLRASIADLSEASARDLEEVERRGLTGGIDLVRNIREEIRDIDFQLSEASSRNATCRAKIAWMHSQRNSSKTANQANGDKNEASDKNDLASGDQNDSDGVLQNGDGSEKQEGTAAATGNQSVNDLESNSSIAVGANADSPLKPAQKDLSSEDDVPASVKIATGDSRAINLRPYGNQGYSPLNLWKVLLRIIGLGGDSMRSTAETVRQEFVRQGAANLMIV